ncbi:MAG: GGDEF domain-containing protein [Magnetococcales bacterium]|nr:GGDEF domain-containing protein [Magnetococcales bacterium]
MKAERLTAELTRIRSLLEEPKPDLRGAFMATRELLTRSPCKRELEEIREAAILILERLTQSALHSERDRQVQVSRLIRAIRRVESLDSETLLPMIEEITPWIAEAALRGGRREPLPNFDPGLFSEALRALDAWESGDDPDEPPVNLVLSSGGGETPLNLRWHDLYRRLGRIITTEHRGRSSWARERKAITEAVAILGADLVEASALIGRKDGATIHWAHGLSDDVLTRPEAVMEALLAEESGYWARVSELEEALARSQEVVGQFQNLLRRAENALMASRDETFVDVATGLPNRFAFLARLARELETVAGEKRPGESFSLIFIHVDEHAELTHSLGRDRAARVLGALATRLTLLPAPEDYLARWSEESFVILVPGTDGPTALALAKGMHASLSRERYELIDALVTLRLGVGVVAWREGLGLTEERLLALAEVEAKAALVDGSFPVRLADPKA